MSAIRRPGQAVVNVDTVTVGDVGILGPDGSPVSSTNRLPTDAVLSGRNVALDEEREVVLTAGAYTRVTEWADTSHIEKVYFSATTVLGNEHDFDVELWQRVAPSGTPLGPYPFVRRGDDDSVQVTGDNRAVIGPLGVVGVEAAGYIRNNDTVDHTYAYRLGGIR